MSSYFIFIQKIIKFFIVDQRTDIKIRIQKNNHFSGFKDLKFGPSVKTISTSNNK